MFSHVVLGKRTMLILVILMGTAFLARRSFAGENGIFIGNSGTGDRVPAPGRESRLGGRFEEDVACRRRVCPRAGRPGRCRGAGGCGHPVRFRRHRVRVPRSRRPPGRDHPADRPRVSDRTSGSPARSRAGAEGEARRGGGCASTGRHRRTPRRAVRRPGSPRRRQPRRRARAGRVLRLPLRLLSAP